MDNPNVHPLIGTVVHMRWDALAHPERLQAGIICGISQREADHDGESRIHVNVQCFRNTGAPMHNSGSRQQVPLLMAGESIPVHSHYRICAMIRPAIKFKLTTHRLLREISECLNTSTKTTEPASMPA